MPGQPVSMEIVERTAFVSASLLYSKPLISLFISGMQAVLCIYGLSCFIQTSPEKRKGRLPYILLSFAILALSGASVGMDLSLVFWDLYYSGPGMDYVRTRQMLHNIELRVANLVFTYGYVVLGDGLLLYRCYIIWTGFPWIPIAPTLIYLGFIGLTIANITRHALRTALSSQPQILISIRIEFAYTFLTAGFNILTTSLIAFRLIRARRSFAEALPGRNTRVYSTAARILIESAVPLALLGFCAAAAGVANWVHLSVARKTGNNPNLNFAIVVEAFNSLYFSFAALSPQMIIFRVTTGRSFTRDDNVKRKSTLNPESRPLSQPLAFNVGQESHVSSESTGRVLVVESIKLGGDQEKEACEDEERINGSNGV